MARTDSKVRGSLKRGYKWIPVKRLPKPQKGQRFVVVIFYSPNTAYGGVCAGRYFPDERHWAWESLQGRSFTRTQVSHWMPMPEAPLSNRRKT